MTFEQALTSAKAGTAVKRSGWSGKSVVYNQTSQDIEVTVVRTTVAPYTATEDDLKATDWTTA